MRNLPLLREIHVGSEVSIATDGIAHAAFARIRIIEPGARLGSILEDIRNAIGDRRSSLDGRSGQVRPPHLIPIGWPHISLKDTDREAGSPASGSTQAPTAD